MSRKIIEMRNISKSYDSKADVLSHLDFTVYEGDYVIIKGKSGSGKSTLLNIIGLLDKHSSGDYIFLDKEIKLKANAEYDTLRGNNIGFVFQSYNLIENYTVLDNIFMPFLYSTNKITSKILNDTNDLLEELDLAQLKHQAVKFLSGGEKQRCAIARAVVSNPRLVIADEPTGNLDGENASIISKQFRKIANNKTTVIVVTHSDHLFQNADIFYELRQGRLWNNAI